MPGNRPCPVGCTCEKHTRSKRQVTELGKARKPCPAGCTCKRHDSAARRGAARSRWSQPGQREAQAEVGREALNRRWSDEGAEEAQKSLDAPLETPATELEAEASKRGIRPPASSTLRRYGLDREEWLRLLANQGWRCPVCHKTGTAVKWNTDHDHVPGWKNRPPEERKKFVRGVLCVYCNFRRVKSRMPAAEAQRIADYLRAYEERRAA